MARTPEGMERRRAVDRQHKNTLRRQSPEYRAYQKDWHQRHKERSNAEKRARYAADTEYRRAQLQASASWRAANPDRARRNSLRHHYGLELTEYERLLLSQSGVCAICEGPPNGRGQLHVDHDHSTGRIRGLLCSTCNTGIGLLKDDRKLLSKAIAYLDKSNG